MSPTSPILFLVFNRPDLTRLVFERIREARPSRLYIAADGPRATFPTDVERCAAVRELLQSIDWPCDVFRNYAQSNMGTKQRVASAITWFFAHEPDGIILEDDCLPHPSFFRFCSELLEKYRHDERIMTISGDCGDRTDTFLPYSYYFSKYPQIWGWASWRRAWHYYDVDLKMWPDFERSGHFEGLCTTKKEAAFWRAGVNSVINGLVDTWDCQWGMTCWMQGGLAIIPKANLVQNVGFREDATHTKDDLFGRYSHNAIGIEFPLTHPTYIIADHRRDAQTWRNRYQLPSLLQRITVKMRQKISALSDKISSRSR